MIIAFSMVCCTKINARHEVVLITKDINMRLREPKALVYALLRRWKADYDNRPGQFNISLRAFNSEGVIWDSIDDNDGKSLGGKTLPSQEHRSNPFINRYIIDQEPE
ncbi:hypothetical protein O9929_01785 [Vibrio lentus]|nr:hypothetical protein [Vibrio lentus]